MPLTTGSRLGSYEILGLLGVGGMGEVYRARDTKLNRDVALKVLPELFAAGPERLARFKREAQVLAALNQCQENLWGAIPIALQVTRGTTTSLPTARSLALRPRPNRPRL